MPTAAKAGISAEIERKELETDYSKIEKGHLMMVYHYVMVENPQKNFTLQVNEVDIPGFKFEVRGKDLAEKCLSADQYQEEIKLSQTKVIEILTQSYNVPFTAEFVKANGEDRKLRGRLISIDGSRGFSNAEDLDNPIGDRMRKIDHRTLKSLIVKGVKYTVK